MNLYKLALKVALGAMAALAGHCVADTYLHKPSELEQTLVPTKEPVVSQIEEVLYGYR